MLRDDDTFPMSVRPYAVDVDEAGIGGPRGHEGPAYVNDDFDDVFGSAPASPSFGTLRASEEGGGGNTGGGNVELSDVPRLKEKHHTEGYRDGVVRGKAQSVQAGFDEGYGLGAVLGLRIGRILGLLDGLCGAVDAAVKKAERGDVWSEVDWVGERDEVEKLYMEAKTELSTANVFGAQWWGDDGIWKFDVPAEELHGKEVVFTDVAAAHPLVVKWERVVAAEVSKWDLDLGLMETDQEETNGGGDVGTREDKMAGKVADSSRAGLTW